MPRGLKGQLNNYWPDARSVYVRVVSGAIALGGSYATLVVNGTGDYTLTLKEGIGGATLIHADPTTIGSSARHAQIAAISASAVQVLTFDLATPGAADADFSIELVLSNKSREY